MENSRRCENFKIEFPRASIQKHSRTRKPLENKTQYETNIPE